LFVFTFNVKESVNRKGRGMTIGRIDKWSVKGMKEVKERAKGGEG
jgi:hypothetical protein